MSMVIDPERCPQNHRCPAVRFCPVQALSQQGNAAPEVDAEACTECGKCMQVCPMGAFSLE